MNYIPITDKDRAEMLKVIGVSGIEDLFKDIPQALREKVKYEKIPQEERSEFELIREFERISERNKVIRDYNSYLGGGVYDHLYPV